VKRTCVVLLAAITAALAPAVLAAPTKITNCPRTITQPGLYELQDNLDSAGTCIVIQADGVTIDLGGFRIRGNRTGAGITDLNGRRGTTVRNGTVTSFEHGIYLENGSVDNVKSFDNASVGITVITGAVRSSHAEGNGHYGISVAGRALVSGNVSLGNVMGIGAGHAAVVHGNMVADNPRGGIVTIGTGLSIANNSVFNNGSFGIGVSCPSLLLANTVLLHGMDLLVQGANCTMQSNVTQ
jgi:hypothetical protein